MMVLIPKTVQETISGVFPSTSMQQLCLTQDPFRLEICALNIKNTETDKEKDKRKQLEFIDWFLDKVPDSWYQVFVLICVWFLPNMML